MGDTASITNAAATNSGRLLRCCKLRACTVSSAVQDSAVANKICSDAVDCQHRWRLGRDAGA